MNRSTMIEDLTDELYMKTTGHTTAITVRQGGKFQGLDYGPSVVEIVVLDHDGKTVAYRGSDDSLDEDWLTGTIEDAVDHAIAWDEVIED